MPQDRQLLDNLKLVNQTMVQDPDLKESLSLWVTNEKNVNNPYFKLVTTNNSSKV